MKGLLHPDSEKPLYALITFVSIITIAMIKVYVYRDCGWLTLLSGGQGVCELQIGWAVLIVVSGGLALYFGWRVYAKPRQG